MFGLDRVPVVARTPTTRDRVRDGGGFHRRLDRHDWNGEARPKGLDRDRRRRVARNHNRLRTCIHQEVRNVVARSITNCR